MLTHEEQQKILGGLLKRKENLYCAECGSKSPCWASLDFGVFVCLNCSGAHRALGPSVTRVKSTRLDSWSREWVSLVQTGNSILNSYWQEGIGESDRKIKPTENSSVEFISKFVKDKYVRSLYVHPDDSLDTIKKRAAVQKKQASSFQTNSNLRPASRPSSKLHKAQTIIGDHPSSKQIKKVEADFSFFDQMVVEKKPVEDKKGSSNHNLIGFEEQKPTRGGMKKGSSSFIDFDFVPQKKGENSQVKEEKYNKQQFMSMGGINPNKPKNKSNIDFDSFHHNAQKKHNNTNLINFQNIQNQSKPKAANLFENYGLNGNNSGQSQPNKANFATMSGMPIGNHPQMHNINNINGINSMHYGTTSNARMGVYSNKPVPFDINWANTPNYQNSSTNKISLESTINFDVKQTVKVEKGPQSWVDQWK